MQQNINLSQYTSWQVGGAADFFAAPVNLQELKQVVIEAQAKKLPITILGGGTNVLISDKGVRGLTISLRKFAGTKVYELNSKLIIEALAGTSKSELLKTFLKYKLSPALFLAGLPGDVGGGVVMNAGVGEIITPREFVEITDWVEVLRDNKIIRFKKNDLIWAYRHCENWQPGIITQVGMIWTLVEEKDIFDKVKAANKSRFQKQPLEFLSCGSVFTNPPGHKSGQLIEQCGLKGFSIGGATISEKHANFIVNTGTASASDIHSVIQHIQKKVLEQKSIQLKTEVVYLGDWNL